MDKNKRPEGREKHVTNNSSGVHKRGSGLGTGPVGSPDGYSGKSNGHGGGGGKRAVGGGSVLLIVAALVLKFLFGGDGSDTAGGASSSQGQSPSALGSLLGSVLGGGTELSAGTAPSSYGGTSSNSSAVNASYSKLDTSVASGSRAKYTALGGNGSDTVTIMVYMCGTDLESKSGMASADLSEMANADFGDNVNVIVYTGGCKQWKTGGISSSTNQIYRVKKGGISRLVESDGAKAMTDPATLSAFIKWAAKSYPASRYELIFWDHGGGSVSGYGYDEKFSGKGSMDLAGINKALSAGGVKFDFVGFDACLMATAETALMLNEHADYMIASEETEPGIGWFYTNWLTELGKNTSVSTLQVGKRIIDDFVEQCGRQCPGQQTTLSIIDLAEFAETVPAPLAAFSQSISALISNKQYRTVSDARYGTREFASSSRIDQVDFVDLCQKMGTSEGAALAAALKGAVKYNRTSANMTNAHGVSIYFPYQRASYVDKVSDTYKDIGMDGSYLKCIREFASLEVSGQVAAGGSASPLGSLLGSFAGSSSSGSSADAIGSLLGAFLGGSGTDAISFLSGAFRGEGGSVLIEGLTGRNSSFMSDSALSVDDAATYISMNRFDPNNLTWKETADGTATMTLPDSQWELVHALDLNMFYDDGAGYVDLGLDNIFRWGNDGELIADTDRNWLAINGQPVAYYHIGTTTIGGETVTTGRVPAMLNKDRVNLWIVFDKAHPHGYIAGAQSDYQEKATLTVAKSMTELRAGDTLEFLCDYYSYNGEYKDSYYLGEPMKVTDKMEISNVDVGTGAVKLMYRFTDIYNQEYWSEALVR